MADKHNHLLYLKRLEFDLVKFQQLLRQELHTDVEPSIEKVIEQMRNCIEAHTHYKRKNALLSDFNSKRQNGITPCVKTS